jgi:hypothetical protein
MRFVPSIARDAGDNVLIFLVFGFFVNRILRGSHPKIAVRIVPRIAPILAGQKLRLAGQNVEALHV